MDVLVFQANLWCGFWCCSVYRADVTSPLRQFQQSSSHELFNNVDDCDRRFDQQHNEQVRYSPFIPASRSLAGREALFIYLFIYLS